MRWVNAVLGKLLSAWISRHKLREPSPLDAPGRRFLHVGCGRASKPDVAKCFLSEDWQEIRLDVDPAVKPDLVASMLDMVPVPDASMDGVYSSHNIEHVYPHEVPIALAEFLRVLTPEGFLVLTCPDLQEVCRLVADNRLTEPAYVSQVGPIAPLDILYGHRPQLADGNLFMAHRSGFTLSSLIEALRMAGFPSVAGRRRTRQFDLWVVATKTPWAEADLIRVLDECLSDE